MMERNEVNSVQDALKAHEDLLIHAANKGKWMTAVWCIDGDKIVLCGRTTWKFPIGDMKPCIELLKDDCQKEIDSRPEHAFGSVLPRACGGEGMLFGVRNTTEMEKHEEKVEEGISKVQEAVESVIPNRNWPAPKPETIDDSVEDPQEKIDNPGGPLL
jgi:hypothetical protein